MIFDLLLVFLHKGIHVSGVIILLFYKLKVEFFVNDPFYHKRTVLIIFVGSLDKAESIYIANVCLTA
jgi:uncharacterized membrane protein